MPTLSVLDVVMCGTLMALVAGCAAAWCRQAWPRALRRALRLGSDAITDETTFATLHTISRASPALRGGLTRESARRAARDLRILLGAEAVAVVAADPSPAQDAAREGHGREARRGRLLAWDGSGDEGHPTDVLGHAAQVLATGRARVVTSKSAGCCDGPCRLRAAVVAPLAVEGRVQGALVAYGTSAPPARVRAVAEVARWMSSQLELAELDSSRNRLAEAEMRALRAQICPHFLYNSLTAIASFVRTDPGRARDLLLDFADFARYSFRTPRDFTTLAEELNSIDRYLLLERARFGDRLRCTVDATPEVLPVTLPFLSLQPLVENAIRHGMNGARGKAPFHVRIVARDAGEEAAISVEDDGAGMDPARLLEILGGGADAVRPRAAAHGSDGGEGRALGMAVRCERDHGGSGAGIGLANVDERMRQLYGDAFGLTVETGIGAGTKVSLRVPKNRAGLVPE
ncbi:histidine kinase [Actinomadura sp. NBRC 104412]|uniref:sensor histidine kinase n=1 Tax=Actinomadura sp. NBRC 104412 TaxID=3032203 RepID=UPI0025564E76|nr:histidine kinase [Actinomadura sp. NBRC 104412]